MILAVQRAPIGNGAEQRLHVRLEAVQVTDAVPGELRPDELTAGVPLAVVRGEDTVAEKVLPSLVELLTLAKVTKLRGQDGLDVLRVRGEDEALVEETNFGRPYLFATNFEELVLPQFEVRLRRGGTNTLIDKVQAW